MPVYTRTGDNGETHLVTGDRVAKFHPRVELYGSVDELNSAIGVAIAHLDGQQLTQELADQQHLLFELGSELAGFRADQDKDTIHAQDIAALEQAMDRIEAQVGPMKSFVLPGGSPGSAFLHLARTICRRLERHMVRAQQSNSNQDTEGRTMIRDSSLRYINRLSDYLFMAARSANFEAGTGDVPWKSRAREEDRKTREAGS